MKWFYGFAGFSLGIILGGLTEFIKEKKIFRPTIILLGFFFIISIISILIKKHIKDKLNLDDFFFGYVIAMILWLMSIIIRYNYMKSTFEGFVIGEVLDNIAEVLI